MSAALDVLSGVFAVVGAVLTLVAAVGLLRLGDTRSRMHAATKPATLGVLSCAVAAALQLDSVSDVSKVAVIVAVQFVTVPAGAHMLARAISRSSNER